MLIVLYAHVFIKTNNAKKILVHQKEKETKEKKSNDKF